MTSFGPGLGPCRAQVGVVARVTSILCQGRATEQHHIKTKARGGSDRPENKVALCWACHRHVHENPKWAHSQGLLLHRWEDERERVFD